MNKKLSDLKVGNLYFLLEGVTVRQVVIDSLNSKSKEIFPSFDNGGYPVEGYPKTVVDITATCDSGKTQLTEDDLLFSSIGDLKDYAQNQYNLILKSCKKLT